MILRDKVTRLRAPLVDDAYGNQRRDWPNATRVTYPAELWPVSSTEEVVNQQRTETRTRMIQGPAYDLLATDRIEWDNGSGVATYEVEGDVEPFKPRGRLHHYEAVLLRVEQGA